MNIRNTIIAVAFAVLLAPAVFAQNTEVFFGQDTGAGLKGRLADYPKSKAVFEKFKSRCGDVDAVDFENLKGKYDLKQWGTTEERKYSYRHVLDKAAKIEMDFGDGETATLSGMTQVIKVTNENATMAGGFPTSGEMAMLLISTSGNANSTIAFDQDQAAFGFYVTDIEANKLALALIRDGQEDETINFDEITVPTANGGICFVGVINKSKPFKGVKLINPGGGSEGFGFDDMMIAKPEQIQSRRDPLQPPSLLGKYENVPPTNDWHYVTIEQGTEGKLRWRNAAGATWTVEYRNGNEIWFAKDCPYGEMKIELKQDEAGNFTGLQAGGGFFRLVVGPKPQLPQSFIVETYGVDGRGNADQPKYFIGVEGNRLKILQAKLENALKNENGVKTITSEKLDGGLVALKIGDRYLPDFAATIGDANKYREVAPVFPPEQGEKDFISLQSANKSDVYLRHSSYNVFNGGKYDREKGKGTEAEKVFKQDVTWHFHEIKASGPSTP